jgi:hypothetical protein
MPSVNHRVAGVFGPAVEHRPGWSPNRGWRCPPEGGRRRARLIHPGAGYGEAAGPYSFGVSAIARTVAHGTEVEAAPDAASYRWLRPLAIVAVGFVVTAAFQTHPGPGAQGQHLAVSVALITFAVATIGVVRLAGAAPSMQLPLLIIAVLSAATLVGLQPSGPGFLGVFPAVSAAALRLRARTGAAVAGIAIAALAIAWALFGHRPVTGVVLNEFGVVAFYLLANFARRYREANEQSHRLIAELEQTRAAQAQAAALGERQRLAREMHDVLAHALSGLVLNLESARLIVERGDADPKIAEAIGRAHRLPKLVWKRLDERSGCCARTLFPARGASPSWPPSLWATPASPAPSPRPAMSTFSAATAP